MPGLVEWGFVALWAALLATPVTAGIVGNIEEVGACGAGCGCVVDVGEDDVEFGFMPPEPCGDAVLDGF